MRRFFAPALLALALQLTLPSFADAALTVVLVRHAEKQTEPGADPPLSDAGHARAAELARVLADADVVAVYSSPFHRTRDTLRPLAEDRELEIRERDPRAGDTLAAEIREQHHQGVVIVAGHSNTIPDLARALGAETDLTFAEQDYDDILILTLHDDGTATMLHLHYGAPSLE